MAAMSFGLSFIYFIVVWKMESVFKFIIGIEIAMDSSKFEL